MQFTISHLDIGYKRHYNIISDINIEIKSGKLTCLIGANGVGKSTFLKTLSGFLPKLKGDIFINNISLSALSHRELAHKISVVLTTKPDVQNVTVEEVIGMGRSPYTGFWGILCKEDKQVIEDSINRVGINSLKGRLINTLSDGEMQKVMIAKALAQETPIILLDEPTAFLDFPSKVDCYKLLTKVAHKLDKIILLSTHDIDLATHFADIILYVSKTGIRTVSRKETQDYVKNLLV